MGMYLSKPITETHSRDMENDQLKCGVSCMQGWRESQEDAHNCILDFYKDMSLFAVYDGHGGAEVAQYASANLPALVRKIMLKEKDLKKVLKKAYMDFDDSLFKRSVQLKLTALREGNKSSDSDIRKEGNVANGVNENNTDVSENSSNSGTSNDDKKFDYENNWYKIPVESNDGSNSETDDDDDYDDDDLNTMGCIAGCTAVMAILVKHRLYVANAGDSRCVVSIKGKAHDMSIDHKPEDKLELSRITAAGGNVAYGRVNGGLNLSRALGDHYYKKNYDLPNTRQMISALPDVRVLDLKNKSSNICFFVLACDGIWNSLSSQEVIDFISEHINKPDVKLSSICEELFKKCLAPYNDGDSIGCDNMTCIIVKLKPQLKAAK